VKWIFIIHWDAAEAERYAETYVREGYKVLVESKDGAAAFQRIAKARPNAVVLYHTRLPSHSLETAKALQAANQTKGIPLFIIGGSGDAIEKTKLAVPDAEYFISHDVAIPRVREILKEE
jgi:CheY-like chemotaxis protein